MGLASSRSRSLTSTSQKDLVDLPKNYRSLIQITNVSREDIHSIVFEFRIFYYQTQSFYDPFLLVVRDSRSWLS